MELKEILEKLAKGEISVRVAEQELRLFSIEYVENLAKIDPLREIRSGIPEVILAQGKELKDLYKIILATISKKRFAVISKVKPEYMERLHKKFEKENLRVEMGINTILVSCKSHKFPTKNGKVG
ncbi:MAG: hypothetical protein ACM31M_06170, partial [Nitrososphaerota archaeon]